jgi:hypothetical protein
MSILDEIRPRAEHLTDEHSSQMLRGILATRTPTSRPRRRLKYVAIGAAGVILAGGTAYAGGMVPSIVSERFGQVEKSWGQPISGERLVVETTLSDGTPIRVWRADTTGGACEIRDTTGTQERPDDFGAGCALWQGPRYFVDVLQACAGHPALLFGELRPGGPPAQRVRVETQDRAMMLPVAGPRDSFSGEIPAGLAGDRVIIKYLDTRGHVIAGDRREYYVDSDTASCP